MRKGEGATSTTVRMMSRKAILDWKVKLKKNGGTDSEITIALAVVNRILGSERALASFPSLKESLLEEQE